MSQGTDTDTQSERSSFDVFEFLTALLLGLAAIGAALASLGAGGWAGKQLELFSESNQKATLASRDYNESVSTMNADYAIVAQAKRLLVEAAMTEDEAVEEEKLVLVSYLYTQQLSWQAMKALGLPKELWATAESGGDDETPTSPAPAQPSPTPPPAAPPTAGDAGSPEKAPAAAGDDAAAPQGTGDEPSGDEPKGDDATEEDDGESGGTDGAEPPAEEVAAAEPPPAPPVKPSEPPSAEEAKIDAALANTLPDALLWGTIDVELHAESATYFDDLYADPMAQFAAAEGKFAEGQAASSHGDKFDLAVIYYTVALFFAGLGLVFKSRMRWPFFIIGTGVFVATSVFMSTIPWSG